MVSFLDWCIIIGVVIAEVIITIVVSRDMDEPFNWRDNE